MLKSSRSNKASAYGFLIPILVHSYANIIGDQSDRFKIRCPSFLIHVMENARIDEIVKLKVSLGSHSVI